MLKKPGSLGDVHFDIHRREVTSCLSSLLDLTDVFEFVCSLNEFFLSLQHLLV